MKSPMAKPFGMAASNEVIGTIKTQASTGVISPTQINNANSNSTLGGAGGMKSAGIGGQKGNKTSGVTSPFKEAIQKGVVSGVGMLTF